MRREQTSMLGWILVAAMILAAPRASAQAAGSPTPAPGGAAETDDGHDEHPDPDDDEEDEDDEDLDDEDLDDDDEEELDDDDDEELDDEDLDADDEAGGGAGDEFDQSASSGPAYDALLAAREREERAVRDDIAWAETVERGRDSALQLFLGVGAALTSSLDLGLRSHMYGDSAVHFLGDVSVLGRVADWLHIGGRLGGRGRGWGRRGAPPATASGMDLMVVAHARGHVGRVVDLGAAVGVGLGVAGLALEGNTALGLSPRLHGSLLVGFRLATGVRLLARFAWDFFTWFDLDRFGHDLELGGPSLSLGLEVRP